MLDGKTPSAGWSTPPKHKLDQNQPFLGTHFAPFMGEPSQHFRSDLSPCSEQRSLLPTPPTLPYTFGGITPSRDSIFESWDPEIRIPRVVFTQYTNFELDLTSRSSKTGFSNSGVYGTYRVAVPGTWPLAGWEVPCYSAWYVPFCCMERPHLLYGPHPPLVSNPV